MYNSCSSLWGISSFESSELGHFLKVLLLSKLEVPGTAEEVRGASHIRKLKCINLRNFSSY